ncbi:TetR/AcrR family transcriptional regulator [Pseudonocardia asaccharolytica]|uniref:TetR family transcriptional regulator n=1 Tax=Pseudonocardia asaccharolytica DSM 44247 = NBRC 16224 TaxID=1123024 RepID=A0A511D2V2_9PSEU|nr:TetR/AcrR family transcriptional regulator [Pseudonocardia asaccharolytica]GEL19112.1 TetR family transcriptional regulator [Pseudonocardia asaccharolytica DSM 44247 = NBRC 16224]
MTTRLTRAEQVERNRELVLVAARRIFLERGYGGANLDAIAHEAGFSKGVVYSQFASKADLFLALLERRISDRAAENARVAAAHAGLDGLLALLRTNVRRTEEGAGWLRLLVEFRVLAARDPGLGRRYADLHARALGHFTEAVGSVLARGGLAPVYPPRVFAELIFAVDAGLLLERAADPAALPVRYLEDLAARLVEPI